MVVSQSGRKIWRDPRTRWVAGSLAVAVVLVVWVMWPAEPPPRAREYIEFTACLLTDEHGVTGRQARPVWAGMQEASLATHAKVEYLAVRGPQTKENASTFLASLAQGQCHLVLAVGAAPARAVADNASRFPDTDFVVVGGEVSSTANLLVLSGTSPEEVERSVDRAVTRAVQDFDAE